MDSVIVVVIVGAVVAGFVQGLSGFAFGLTAMSFWAWVVQPHLAAPMAVFGALTGQIIAAVSVRRSFHWPTLLPYLAGGLFGIPIGVAILPGLDIQLFKTVLGAFLVLWCPLMLAAHSLPRIKVGGRWADAVVGAMGGVMGGLGGFSGTLPTLWCTLRGLPKDEQRAIIQNFNLAAQAVVMGLYVAKGMFTPEVLPMFAIVAPAMLIPTLLGARLYIGISEAMFRKIVLSMLTLSGIFLLASALPQVLGRMA